MTTRFCVSKTPKGRLLAISLASALGNGCGDRDNQFPGMDVSMPITPIVNREEGKTILVVEYLVRDADGSPMGEGDFSVSSKWNNQELDDESLGDAKSTPLSSVLNFYVVLDASYSMTQHNPPAFGPMLAAAGESVSRVREAWEARAGEFSHDIIWFDDWVLETQGEWTKNDIKSIPVPEQGTATKLLSATEYAVRRMRDDYDAGIASGPRDQHILLIFSDGKDNYSHFDQSESTFRGCVVSDDGQACVTTTGARYLFHPTPSTTREGVASVINQHPNLTVNVIGLGSEVDDTELGSIAAAGGGNYIHSTKSSDIDSLFEKALQQFVEQQTLWYSLPEPEGENTITLEFRRRGSSKVEARCYVGYSTLTDPYSAGWTCEAISHDD